MNEHDLLSIKDFSTLTGIRQSTLRHYDEVKLFQPIKRGENGYRYYSPTQAIAINFIQVMGSLGIPLKQISEIQKSRTPERMLDLLHKQAFQLNQELLRLHQAYMLMHTYREIIQAGLAADEDAIGRMQMEEMPIELGKVNDFSSGFFYDSFFDYIRNVEHHNLDAACPVGGYYQDFNAFHTAPGQPNRYFSLTASGTNRKDAGEYLVGYTRGYYGQLGDLPVRMQKYAEENCLLFCGPVYELYLHDEVSIAEPTQYLIQACAQVRVPSNLPRQKPSM